MDMDGVLFDTERVYRAATVSALEALGLEASASLLDDMVGQTDERCDHLLLALFGPAFPTLAFQARYTHHKQVLLAGGPPLCPFAHEFLQRARARSLPVALVTNAPCGVARRYLAAAALDRAFTHVITADDVDAGKPAPDPYACAARRLGQPPARCVAIEDSEPGASSAAAAGMPVILVGSERPRPTARSTGAPLVVPGLRRAWEHIVSGETGGGEPAIT
jgi:HAD superfamily hydrolase (TIGR01509 family)